MFRFKSIRAAILGIILPIFIMAMLILGSLGYFYSKAIINDEINKKMQYQLNSVTENIEKRLSIHNQLAVELSKSIEASLGIMAQENYISMLEKFASSNDETFGNGVWFEPYKFDSSQKYFGPYVFKDNKKTVATMDYSNESYDYFKYDWYKSGISSNESSVWSSPYYDDTTKITMITTTVPFHDINNKFMGVVTADINLNNIQKMIQDIKVGSTGKAFLLNTDGMYISNKDSKKIMKSNILKETNKSLAQIGQTILENKKGNGTYDDDNGVNKIYYSQIPQTKWILALTIPEKELYSSLNNLLKNIMIIIIISLIVVISVVLVYTNLLNKNISKLKSVAKSIAGGDLTINLDSIHSKDEIGQLNEQFSIMVDNIKNIVTTVKEMSEKVLFSSNIVNDSTQGVSKTSEEIIVTMGELANGTTDQAASTESANIKLMDMLTKLNYIVNNINESKNFTNDANQKVDDGKISVENQKIKKKENKLAMNNVSAAMEELAQNSSKIGEIVNVINQISQQTNLLSLNASIEAARAGEAGKGFVVVAEEIRKLSDETSNSINEIQNIITHVQTSVKNAVEEMNKANSLLSEEELSLNNTVNLFDNIYISVKTIAENIENISAQCNLINEEAIEAGNSISNIASVSEQTAAATEEVLASVEEQTASIEEISGTSDELANLSQKLLESVDKFKI